MTGKQASPSPTPLPPGSVAAFCPYCVHVQAVVDTVAFALDLFLFSRWVQPDLSP
ncbi:MAG: hypothetical protein ACKO63_06345 [Nodosilinea sp.]